MSNNSSLEILKQSFERIISTQNWRTIMDSLEFIIELVFCYLCYSKTFSLESIRRTIQNYLHKRIGRSAFWECLSRKKIKQYLRCSVAELTSELTATVLVIIKFKSNLVWQALGLSIRAPLPFGKVRKIAFPARVGQPVSSGMLASMC